MEKSISEKLMPFRKKKVIREQNILYESPKYLEILQRTYSKPSQNLVTNNKLVPILNQINYINLQEFNAGLSAQKKNNYLAPRIFRSSQLVDSSTRLKSTSPILNKDKIEDSFSAIEVLSKKIVFPCKYSNSVNKKNQPIENQRNLTQLKPRKNSLKSITKSVCVSEKNTQKFEISPKLSRPLKKPENNILNKTPSKRIEEHQTTFKPTREIFPEQCVKKFLPMKKELELKKSLIDSSETSKKVLKSKISFELSAWD